MFFSKKEKVEKRNVESFGEFSYYSESWWKGYNHPDLGEIFVGFDTEKGEEVSEAQINLLKETLESLLQLIERAINYYNIDDNADDQNISVERFMFIDISKNTDEPMSLVFSFKEGNEGSISVIFKDSVPISDYAGD